MATGLFGQNPNDALAAQQAADEASAVSKAGWTPDQWAGYAQAKGGQMAGRGIRGMLGIEDPALKELAVGKAMMEGVDLQDPDALEKLAKAYADRGMHRFGEEAFNRSRTLRKEKADVAEQVAKADKAKLSLTQEQKLRDELAALGPDATEEQYLQVVRKYGKPDEVMKSIEARIQKQAALEEKQRAAEAALANKLELARIQGATQAQIAQMNIEGRREIAAMMAQTRLAVAEMGAAGKTDKAAEKQATKEEGIAALDDSLTKAESLINDLEKAGGIASTKKSSGSNLLTNLQTGTVGQTMGRLTGTENQAKRDELSSLRLQLLNDIKQATGMSSRAMDSNQELKTWLASLGSEGMTAEANRAIIKNIRERFIRNRVKPEGTFAPPSNTDAAAIAWAKANPKDPRSSAILKANGL